MKNAAIVLIALIGLSGCALKEAQRKARAEAQHAQCVSYGFAVGSPEYSNCRMLVALADDQRRATVGAALLQKSRTCQAYGNTVQCY